MHLYNNKILKKYKYLFKYFTISNLIKKKYLLFLFINIRMLFWDDPQDGTLNFNYGFHDRINLFLYKLG